MNHHLWLCANTTKERRFITMAQSTIPNRTQHFSPAASLAALGVHLQQIDLLGPVCDTVTIAQKTVKYMPFDKLSDAFISIWPRRSSIGPEGRSRGACWYVRPV